MKKIFFTVLLTTLVILSAVIKTNAQVTIGEDQTPNATLDVRSKATMPSVVDGILTPKLTGDQLTAKNSVYNAPQDGALVYVTAAATAPAGKTINVKAPGYYYFDAQVKNVWVSISQGKSDWFYMPPVPINVDTGNGKTMNLFSAYSASVTPASGASGSVGSGSTPFTDVSEIGSATDYDYYVVGFDPTVFEIVSISTSGLLTYNIKKTPTDNSCFINVVFVRK